MARSVYLKYPHRWPAPLSLLVEEIRCLIVRLYVVLAIRILGLTALDALL